MRFKLTSVFVACCFAVALFVGTTSAAPKPSKLESYHKWLQGGWGQITKDSGAVELHGCALKSITPDPMYKGKLHTRYDLNIGFFYDGVISFGTMGDNLHVISNYTLSDLMLKDAYKNLRKSVHSGLTLNPGVDKKGFVTFNFDKDVPGLQSLRTIVPLTNTSFKLLEKADDMNAEANAYYFTRCDNP